MITKERLLKFDLEDELFRKNNAVNWLDLLNTLHKIQGVNQFLLDLPSFPAQAKKIFRHEMILAVGGTQRIEGVDLTDNEIEKAFDKEEAHEELQTAEKEAVNSKNAYKFIIDYVDGNRDKEIDERFIRQLHTYMTRGLPYQYNKPGEYRTVEISFGSPRRSAVLKTERDVKEGMKGFIKWLNDKNRGNFYDFPLTKANLAHYYLTEIHPFGDGNGRTARALEAMILYSKGKFNYYCFWSLANHFSIYRNKYIDNLRNVSVTLNVMPFLDFASNGYLKELNRIKKRALSKIKELMFMDYIRYLQRTKVIQDQKINERMVSVLDILVELKKLRFSNFLSLEDPSIKGIYTKKSYHTVRKDLSKLREYGFIKITGENKAKSLEPNYKILEKLRYKV